MISKAFFSQGINNLLASIDSGIDKQILNEAIPLFGDKLKDTKQLQFIEDIKTAISKELKKAPQNLDASDITAILNTALGDKGLKVLEQAIDVVEQGEEFEFNLKLGKASSFSTNIATDIGVPNLNLKINSTDGKTPQAKLDYDFKFDLDFTVDSVGTVKSNYGAVKANEIEFNIKASTPDLQAKANLGPLKLILSNDKLSPTNIEGEFVVDLDTTASSLIKDTDSFVSANLNLDAKTSIGSGKIPSLEFDLLFDWKSTDRVVDKPELEFGKINLDLGTYIAPIVDKIGSVLKPVNSVVGFIDQAKGALTKDIPFLTKYASFLDTDESAAVIGKVTLLDLAKLYKPDLKLDFLDAATKTISLIGKASSLTNAKVNLGTFNIGDFDLRNSSFATITSDRLQITDEKTKQDVLGQLQGDVANFFKDSDGIPAQSGGFDFKLISDPESAFKLLLGKSTPLFEYDMPEFNISTSIQEFFPIYGPLGATIEGELKGKADFKFGYELDPNQPSFEKSFYISDWDKNGIDIPEVELEAALNAYASVDFKVGSTGAGGGIKGILDLNLKDIEKDGKVFASELAQADSPLCIFDVTGALVAGLRAYVSYGFGPFKKTSHFDGGSVVLATFEYGCDSNGQPGTGTPPVLATKLNQNVLRLNVGKDAGARKVGNIEDVAEAFAISHVSGVAGKEEVSVAGFGFTQKYKTTSKIVAKGGAEADSLIVRDSVKTGSELRGGAGTDYLKGGAGKDTLHGEDGNDKLEGGANNDTLFGSKGNDLLIGGAGADKLDGNEDNDTVSYSSSKAAVDVSLDRSVNKGGDANGDSLISIENLEGSQLSDTLGGNKGNNLLIGLKGDDKIFGKDGNDLLDGGAGKDILDGGNGVDSVSYGMSSVGVNVNLATGVATGGDATGDKLVSIENVEGTIFDDIIIGNDANNILSGVKGGDSLNGGAGDDTLFAPAPLLAREDKSAELTGGAGRDNFVVAYQEYSYDDEYSQIIIKDFNPAEDKLVTDIPFNQSDFWTTSVGVDFYLKAWELVFEGVTDSSLFNTSNVVQVQTSEIYSLGVAF